MSASVASQEDEMATMRAAKKSLRRIINQNVKALSSDNVAQQSRIAVMSVCAREDYRAAKRISIYLSMEGSEIQTNALVKDALANGKSVFVPYTYMSNPSTGSEQGQGVGISVMDVLSLHSWDDYQSLEKDKWGIPTPARESAQERENCFGGRGLTNGEDVTESREKSGIDLIIVPAVAFDRSLGRLGHGKGYYDHFLQRMKDAVERKALDKMPALVGLALKEQIVPDGQCVPMSKQDWRVDSVVVGDGSSIPV